jgi:carboxylesterase 2
LLAIPPEPLPFRAAILESEAESPSTSGAASWQSLVSALNCTTATSQLACVRAAPATQIKSIIEHNALSFSFVPDNVTAVANTGPIFASKSAANVPFMIGTNANEGRPFAYEALLSANVTLDQYLNSILPGQPALIAAIEAAYPPTIYNSSYLAISAVITDLIFLCPAAAIANTAATAGYDVWRYYFNASFPNTQLFPNAGVFHSSEIPEVFGTYPTAGATAQQIKLSAYMQRVWANFAKNPSSGAPWPKIGSNLGFELGDLGANGSSGEITVSTAQTDVICLLFAPVLAVTGL